MNGIFIFLMSSLCLIVELSLYLQQKGDLEYKQAKQTQKSFLKTDQISIEADTTSSANIIGCPKSISKRKRLGGLMGRKFVLDITESCAKIKNSFKPPTVVTSSANSQVRKYLKSLYRKESLEKTVHKLRENYGVKNCQSKICSPEKLDVKKGEDKIDNSSKNRQDVNYHLKLLESGWIQDSNGKWIKDPNVEFDSDEEEPPKCP